MTMKFFNPEKPRHMRVWVYLILELREFGGYLEDTRENIEAPLHQLGGWGLTIQKVLEDLEINTQDDLEKWLSQHKEMLDPMYLEIDITGITEAKVINDLIEDKPWIDPAGGIHDPDETDPARKYE